MIDKPLPCPFCGSSDLTIKKLYKQEQYTFTHICRVTGFMIQAYCPYETKADVIRAWNSRRPPEPEHTDKDKPRFIPVCAADIPDEEEGGAADVQ